MFLAFYELEKGKVHVVVLPRGQANFNKITRPGIRGPFLHRLES